MYKYTPNEFSFRVWVSHPIVILSVVEGSSVAKIKSNIFALRLDVSAGST